MKNLRLLVCTVMSFMAAQVFSQDIHVSLGNVTYIHSAEEVGDMTFGNSGTTLTIQGKTYTLSEITGMEVLEEAYEEKTVRVNYTGESAVVKVSGDIASEVTATVNGAHVTVTVNPEYEEEIAYDLTGSSDNGSFTMNGDYKSELRLENLQLTNTTGAAISINNGKRLDLILVGENTLTDGTNGTQKACFEIGGHPEISGQGTLNIIANSSHGIDAGDYVLIEGGTINIQAVGDGLRAEQYFNLKSGTVNIQSVGDGIDVGFKGVKKGTKDQYPSNGFAYLFGGNLSIVSTGQASKGLKADSTVCISGTTVDITVSGNAYYDSEEDDIKSSAGIKSGGDFEMVKGSLNILATGSGGKGTNIDYDIKVSGGEITIVTLGGRFEYGDDDAKPQGLKASGSMTLTGGLCKVAVTDKRATALKKEHNLVINGATTISIGGKPYTPLSSGSQNCRSYYPQNNIGGNSYIYDNIEFYLPTGFTNSTGYVITSSPDM